MVDIDKLGKEVAAKIAGAEKDKTAIASDLRTIWEALEAKQTVNGVTSKKDWAKKFNVSLRYCQYLVKDGTRKRNEKEANRVRVLDGVTVGLRGLEIHAGEGEVTVEFERVRIDTYRAKVRRESFDWSDKPADKDGNHVWQHRIREISGNVSFELADSNLTQEQVTTDLMKKMKSGLKALHLWDDKLVTDYKKYADEFIQYNKEMAEQRSQSAQKARETRQKRQPIKPVDPAKELMNRLRAAKRAAKFYVGAMKELTDGVDGDYAGLLNLWGDTQPNQLPWTPPAKDYKLPKKEKEFQIEYDKAIAEFDAVLEEGKAQVVLTTEPKKRFSLKASLAQAEALPEEPLSEPARALAAAVDGTELSWSQKVCMPGSPEREQWRKDLAWRREHPPIDPNEGDEFEGEGD
jgi:hypothetical protein